MRISDWSSDVWSSDLTRSARTRTVFVGWVERSGFQQRSWSTLRPPAISRTMGFAALYPSYGVRLWLGGVEAVVVEDRVEDQRVVEIGRASCRDRVCK